MTDTPNEYRSPAADDGVETIVFLGDGLTRAGDWAAWFSGLTVLNLGVDGDMTADLLARLDQVVAAHPDTVVLMVGTNDFGMRLSVEHVVRNIENVLVELRRDLPGARMLVQSILPRTTELASRIQDANRHVRQFAATVPAQYLDLWPIFGVEGGQLNPAYSDDRFHLNDAGYEAWLSELRPGLERLRDEPPMSRPIHIVRPDEYAGPR